MLGQVAVALVVGYATWSAAARVVPRLQRDEAGWGLPEQLLFSIVGFVAFSIVVMIANIVTGGAAFGTVWVGPLVAVGVMVASRRAILGMARNVVAALRFPGVARRALPWVAAALLLGALYVWPALHGGSGARTGDVPSHLGWTAELLGGESVPSGPAPHVPDNAYPWGLHAVMAALVRLAPGTDALMAVDALHVLLVAALPLAAACLARRLRPGAGWAGAACFALLGGFGWASAGKPDFALSPSDARYGADLVVASPNSLYELFPPSLPRELGLLMLGGTAVLLLTASIGPATRRARTTTVAAGLCAGMTGLVSMPLFVCAVSFCIAAGLLAPARARLRALTASLLPALGVFSLWLGPVVAGYLREGGFVDITARLGVEWSPLSALASWGLLFPLAVAGVVFTARRVSENRDAGAARRLPIVFLALLAAAVLLLALAYARRAFDWQIASNATLLHTGRFWPALHLFGSALAGVALVAFFGLLAKRSRVLAAGVTAALLGVGAVSPAYASVALGRVIREHDDGYVYGAPDLRAGSFVRRAAVQLGPGDVLRVDGPPELAYAIFQFSGVRLAAYDDARFEGNDLRIRYADLAAKWNEVAAEGGYEAGYLVRREGNHPAPGEPVATGSFEGTRWWLLRL